MIRSLHALVFAATLALLPTWAPAQDAGAGIPEDTEIQTTASGLKYSVLKKGTGTVHPNMGDPVKVHYTGWLTNGKQFDSSRTSGRPASFRVGQLITGWNEALQLMVAGDRWKLTIPAELGYGAGGQGADIPGGATLIFDVELVEVTAMPRYAPLDPEKTTKTESGLSYQIVKAGDGATPTLTDGVELRHALWDTTGKLLDCTETSRGGPMQVTCAKPPLAFFAEAMQLMRPGAVYRFSVPKELTKDNPRLGTLPGDATIWELEILRVVKALPVPTFSVPADSELETTQSGLRYQVIREGDATGPSPKMGEDVTCHYAGWLTDGTLFDSSYARGFETTFQLGRVIPGWNEGLRLMKPGAIYKFVIPPQLAYGGRQMGELIKPNSTLVFQVELVRVGK